MVFESPSIVMIFSVSSETPASRSIIRAVELFS
jgi:hypothetical protein